MSSHGSRVGAAAAAGGALSRQGSVCSLTTFSEVDGQLHGVNLDDLLRSGRKTADEVWRDIQGAAAASCPRAQMTLEDFLSRGGGPPEAAAADTGSGSRGWAQQLYQQAPAPAAAAAQLELGRHHRAVGRPVPRPLGVGAGPVLGALYHDGQEGDAGAAAGAKRAAGEGSVAERCNERRKKRMIKNRESAARSRSRKQVTCQSIIPQLQLH